MTLTEFVKSDILATCSALGTQKGLIYETSAECLECLRDLLRYLKNDYDDHSVIRYLGSIRLLQTDIIPIIKQYHREQEIFDFALRLLVAITNPALLLYKEELPDEKLERNVYLQIVSCLQTYKKALIDSTFWKALYVRLYNLLDKSAFERTDDENLTIERILITVRNVLHVPSDESSCIRTDDDYSLHDKLLLSIHESKLDLLVLYMAANEDEHDYCLHVLEIISLMLREHTAADLARTADVRSDAEKEEDLNTLMVVRQREQHMKIQKLKSLTPRFSRFNGVYQVKNMKSLSDKDYIAHKFVNLDEVKFDAQKSARRTPKNRLPARDQNETRRSKFTVRLLLKKICIEFLKSYNKLLVSVKRHLQHNKTNENDDTYFLWVIRYFMEFNRIHDFNVAFVAETISMQTFHHIQTEINNYLEMMLTDKKKMMFWSRRTQLGVSAYKELLETLRVMERSKEEVIRYNADLIIQNVFYVIEYRELLYTLLIQYDEVKFPLSYLAELVESVYLFLRMLENHSKRHSEVIVQTKKRTVRRRKKKSQVEELVAMEQLLNDQWETISGDLFAATQGEVELPTNLTPFDGASNISFTEQKVEVVYKIRDSITANDAASAVALLRAARELWPEGDAFGNATISAEEEVNILKEIHFSNVQRTNSEGNTVEHEESDVEEEEMEASMPSVAEKKLEIDEVYKKYASPKVVQPCCLLLANYHKNSDQTNTSLIKLIHKIACNCKMYALFFQSTVFVTFHKIFNDPEVNFCPIIKAFYRFGKFIMSKFFETAEENPKIFVEMLFWKGVREVYKLEEGYGASENSSSKLIWTEEEDEELQYLFEENKDVHIEGQDVADIICAIMNKKSKSKKQIISALKRLGLISNAKDLKPHLSKEWRETEVLELTHLFSDYRDSEDIMSDIRERLSIKRSRKAIVEKLLELNLITDRKEVKKKKSKKQNKNNGNKTIPLSSKSSKAKRKLIIFSDDNDITEINSNKKTALIDEDKSAKDSSNLKLKKKKIRILLDSDDSS
ncbi:protein timeless homolog [Uloborus diversus]|uniref:protein timeless homolog n=1 Tax=Uloborus diversus TaxID=327109 RepID=UPI0024093F63|nr:protein timeless homolog [Uloborus diversus]